MGALSPVEAIKTSWIPYSFTLSIFFISGFYFVGMTVQKFGIGLATLMQKMSLVISVAYMMVIFGESVTTLKMIGILLAIISILLYNNKALAKDHKSSELWLLPLLTWVISGIIEVLLFLGQHTGNVGDDQSSFVTMIFFGAFVIGITSHLIKNGFAGLEKRKNWTAGIVLGVPNFFSMYFLVKALNIGWEGSVVFPINNIGVLILSSIVALLVFQEKINTLRWIGLTMAVAAIVLLTSLN